MMRAAFMHSGRTMKNVIRMGHLTAALLLACLAGGATAASTPAAPASPAPRPDRPSPT